MVDAKLGKTLKTPATLKWVKHVLTNLAFWKNAHWVTPSLAVGDITLPSHADRLGLTKVYDVRHLFDEDFTPRWPDAHIFAVKVADELRLGERVGLYCYGGIDRSPFIAALVLHWLESTSLGEAYTVVLRRRPQAFRHPEWERGFREWLAGLGRKA